MAKKRSTAAKPRNVVAQARAGSGGSRAGTGTALKRVWENIKALAGAVLIYLVIKALLMEAFRIPSGSMIRTVLGGVWLFGNKPAYGAVCRLTIDNWGPLLIPSGNYFMMGDNRYESKDSRYWGVVPRANVRGRPMFIYYTFVPSAESDRPVSFITDIRWSRLGTWIR